MKIGATTRSQISGFVEIDSEKLIKHPKFTPDPVISYDVGLIKLKKAISSSGRFKSKYQLHVLDDKIVR